MSTYPKAFPGFYLLIQGVSGTGSVHHLSVPLHGEVGYQPPPSNSARRQLISHQRHGALRRQPAAVVSDEGNAVSDGVVTEGVGSLPVPSTAHVDVPIGACDEAFQEHTEDL